MVESCLIVDRYCSQVDYISFPFVDRLFFQRIVKDVFLDIDGYDGLAMRGFHVLCNNAGFFEPDELIEIFDFALYFFKPFLRELRFTIEVIDILLRLVELFLILFIQLLEQVELIHECFIIGF
jgi:hypothetical protein